MDRSKKIWSVVLLCALILLTVLIVLLAVGIGELFGSAETQDSREAAFGWLLVFAAIVYLLPLSLLFFGALGVIISGVNIKIAQSKVIKGISIGFCVLYSLLLLLGVALGVYYWIQFNLI